MTYDHNAASSHGAPNAPIDWVEDQSLPHLFIQTKFGRILHFVGNKGVEARSKLLVGLNMYGTIFQPSRRPITGKEYIELLEKYKPKLEWDSDSEESYFEVSDDEKGDGEVWYPSLYSIRYVLLINGDGNGRKRLSLVEDYRVGGVSLWELGQVCTNIFEYANDCRG
jgi:chitinase domain-containing protein 1